jgi:alginate O-acetyltransferase complex protein AlgI
MGFKALLRKAPHHITLYLMGISLIFYAMWDWRNLWVLIPSILFNYTLGRQLQKRQSGPLLAFGICTNIILLIYYKYFTFLLSQIGLNLDASLSTTLPLGISFFTFTQISYLVDTYQKKTEGTVFKDYSLFVVYFPHLISGPLLHHKDMISQFTWKNVSSKDKEYYAIGLAFLILGLTKKVFLADRLSLIADPVFLNLKDLTMIEAWKGILAYTFQLYFDFSGYSDMAIGISKLFHITMPINFNSPYKATSIIEFWRRWHITLSNFLKDYIYIPLGGNRDGQFRKLQNIFIVMLICGVWHGAGYTFFIWGLWHGFFLIANHVWRLYVKTPIIPNPWLSKGINWSLTFFVVILGWVFFRSSSLSNATEMFSVLFFGQVGNFLVDKNWLLIFAALLLSTLGPNSQQLLSYDYSSKYNPFSLVWRPNPYWAAMLACLATYSLVRIQPISPFLYWQF